MCNERVYVQTLGDEKRIIMVFNGRLSTKRQENKEKFAQFNNHFNM